MWWDKAEVVDESVELVELQETIAKLEAAYNEKLNPAQEEIALDQAPSTQYTSRYSKAHIAAYNNLEVVNRGVNIIADAVGEFNFDTKGKLEGVEPIAKYVREPKIKTLLNHKSSEYISANELKRNIAVELLLEGNAFIYFDGVYIYIIPSIRVEIKTDKKGFVEKYIYGEQEFTPKEIVHIRDNSATSIYRGASRLSSAVDSIAILQNMNTFQKNFFKNNTILGIVLSTPDMLSHKLKQRKVMEWMRDYNPTSGGRKPLILDGGYKIEDINKYSFKELDFAESTKTQENKILEALGVPPVLLNSGNNANISPNLKLLYTNTVLPIVTKITAAFEIFFGIDLKPVIADVMALRPELKDQANYLTTLVNSGIMTRNEARAILRLEKYTKDPEIGDELFLPANIDGSAQDAGVGGKPPADTED